MLFYHIIIIMKKIFKVFYFYIIKWNYVINLHIIEVKLSKHLIKKKSMEIVVNN